MPPSPLAAHDGPFGVRVQCGGADLPDSLPLVELTVQLAADRVPSAHIVLLCGVGDAGTVDGSGAAWFKPGTEVSIGLGHGGRTTPVFNGVVAGLRLRIDDTGPRLEVECRDRAMQMSVGRRSAVFDDMTDSQVIESLIARHGLQADVDATPDTHAVLVQHDVSDWDFLLARAAANGLGVTARDGRVTVSRLQPNAAAALQLGYGIDMIRFEAETGAGLGADSRLRGRVSFPGSALALPGSTLSLTGVGKPFDGDVLVTAVRHHVSVGEWVTDVDFGAGPETTATQGDTPPSAATGAPGTGVHSLQIGEVVDTDEDPLGECRVKVRLRGADDSARTLWARLAMFQASRGFGAFFVPQPGDEVVLGCADGDPSRPVVLGSLYGNVRRPPYPAAAQQRMQGVVTRSGSRIEFDDERRRVAISTPGGHTLVLSDEDQAIAMSDAHGNRIELGAAGITLDSPRDIRLSARGGITLDAAGPIGIRAAGDLAVQGLNVGCTAQVGFKATGQAATELSAAGTTTIKGALVLIN